MRAETRNRQARNGRQPNVVLILADDMGYSDIGAFGGEIHTPNLDLLAAEGTLFSRFYNTARCSTSRASLLTGLHPQQTGIGILTQDDGPAGYPGTLNKSSVTLAEILKRENYRTHLSGKWHLVSDRSQPNSGWPTRRGFDSFFGTLTGCGSYFDPGTLKRNETDADDAQDPNFYYTDAIGDDAVEFITRDQADPFFLYTAFTTPHWPLHALKDDVEKVRGSFDSGWDELRVARLRRQKELGIIPDSSVELSERDPEIESWEQTRDKEWQIKRMEAYAAMVHSLDRNVGKILDALDRTGQRENTIVVFLSDNGASYEEISFEGPEAEHHRNRPENFPGVTRTGDSIRLGNHPSIDPGGEDTYASYGRGWANVSNTPFRMYKEWVHEGGIATPFLISWDHKIAKGKIDHTPLQLVDVLPTLLDLTGAKYPDSNDGQAITPLPGTSFADSLQGGHTPEHDLFWEHLGNCAVRSKNWKLVREFRGEWELYNVESDPTERTNIASKYPEQVQELEAKWNDWAARCGVKPFENIISSYVERGLSVLEAKGS